MSHPLDGADDKLDRAQVQIDELKEEIDAFILSSNPKPYTPRLERHNERVERRRIAKEVLQNRQLSLTQLIGPVDELQGVVIAPVTVMEVGIYLDPLRPFPARRLGVLVGEIVHNLRCALDYLVWELGVKQQRHRPPDVIRRGDPDWDWRVLQFPIVPSSKQWAGVITDSRRRRSQLWAIDQTLLADFERLQPFYGGKNPFAQWLWMLHELWNGDKHRTVPIVAMAGNVSFAFPGSSRIIKLVELAQYFRVLDRNTEIARYGLIALRLVEQDGYDPTVDVHPLFKLDVAFDPRSAVGSNGVVYALRSMADEVEAILDQFRPLF
jgi:hypothetical protein